MKASVDFLVIGSQKAGTTALFEYLRRHPELFVPAGKENPFYSHDDIWREGWNAYANHHFALAGDDRLWGTVSPHYMYGAPHSPATTPPEPELVIPRRILEHSPRVKLVAILRDPVDRAYSHHRMQLMNEWETRSFSHAVEALLQPAALAESRRSPLETNTYISNGEYGRILAPFFSLFDRSQILTLFHRDLLAEPRAVLQTLFTFLGVDDAFVPPNLGKRYRVGAARRRLGWVDPNAFQARVAEVAPLRVAWRRMPPSVRARVKATYKEVSYRIDLTNRIADSDDAPAADVDEAKRRLREHYVADRRVLVELIGVEPPWWPAPAAV